MAKPRSEPPQGFQIPAAKVSLPLSYEVRESRRAKHLNIKISHQGEMEVVIPVGFDRRKIPAILDQKRRWIEKTQHKIAAERQKNPGTQSQSTLPTQVLLRSPAETWPITYQKQPGPLGLTTNITTHGEQQILLRGNITDPRRCRQILRQWLRHKAYAHLSPWLCQLSQIAHLPYGKISVRGQKTLWGSCSSQKNISLNYKLLFLPDPMVRYVLIHELCHTVHMNHSPEFWALVGENEPDYKRLDQETNKGWRYLPDWIELD